MARTLLEFKIDTIRDELKHQKDCVRMGMLSEKELAIKKLPEILEMIQELKSFLLEKKKK